MVIGKLKKKSRVIDPIETQMIIACLRKFFSEITKFFNSIRYKEEMLDDWKESIISPLSKKVDKTESSNYRGVSHLSITYKLFIQHLAVNAISLHRVTYRESLELISMQLVKY
jgi:hypothetical protein